MANLAYLRVWTRDFSESTMIAEFARFLTTAPSSAARPGFRELTIQPIDPSEAPVGQWDLRDSSYGPAETAALAAQHLNADTAYIVSASWDLWTFDAGTLQWKLEPQPLELACHGTRFDDGVAATAGHFAAVLGFEHFFTGHGGLLAPASAANPFGGSGEHPVERSFRQWMAADINRKEYHAKTRQNIQQLLQWVEAIEQALPVERSELSSEGEENFEARLDAILAQR